MIIRKNLVWLFVAAVFFSCQENVDNPSGGQQSGPVDDGGKYTEQEVTINRDGVKAGSATLRFYDKMGDVPYISVTDFHKVMLPSGSMTVNRMGDVYEIINSGGTATVDVKSDRLTSSAFFTVFDLSSLIGTGIPSSVSYDGAPYIKPIENILTPSISTVSLDFGKHHIDLYDDGSNIYFPYATLADIYSDMSFHVTYYNDAGRELIVSTETSTDAFKKIEPGRKERIFNRKEVSEKMASYRYNELCFVFDYIYGYPGRNNELFRVGLENCGLDAALDKAQAGTKVKELLKSRETAAFVLGMDALQYYAYDRGHTNMAQSEKLSGFSDLMTRYEALTIQYPEVAALIMEQLSIEEDFQNYAVNLMTAREKIYGDKKYILSSDKSTAVLVLNSFMDVDLEGWKTYYASQKTEADKEALFCRDGNMFATFLKGVQQARKDGAKNVILDLTLNGGGSSDIAIGILSLIAKDEALRQKVTLKSDYVLSKQSATTRYIVDRNFDGKFDAEDAKVDFSDLNFTVLTSNYSFSCANLMPSLMKDSGFKVVGEQSGGGVCAIQMQFTPEGIDYSISCHRMRLMNVKGENIDKGIPVDIAVAADKLYDIDYLAQKVKE